MAASLRELVACLLGAVFSAMWPHPARTADEKASNKATNLVLPPDTSSIGATIHEEIPSDLHRHGSRARESAVEQAGRGKAQGVGRFGRQDLDGMGDRQFGRHRRSRKSSREDEARVSTRHYGYQEQHDGVRDRSSRVSRSCSKAVRETSALYDLPGRLGGDHGVSAASGAVTRPGSEVGSRSNPREDRGPVRRSGTGASGWASPSPPARLLTERVLVDFSVLHDEDEVLGRILDQLDVLDRVAVDEKQVGQRAFFDDTERAGVRIAFAGQCQQFGVRSGGHCERLGGTVPADKRGQNCALLLRQRLRKQDIGPERRLDLVLLRQLVGPGYARPDLLSLRSLD